jgi:hypothetical protein
LLRRLPCEEIRISTGMVAAHLVVGVTHGNSFSGNEVARTPLGVVQPVAGPAGLQKTGWKVRYYTEWIN